MSSDLMNSIIIKAPPESFQLMKSMLEQSQLDPQPSPHIQSALTVVAHLQELQQLLLGSQGATQLEPSLPSAQQVLGQPRCAQLAPGPPLLVQEIWVLEVSEKALLLRNIQQEKTDDNSKVTDTCSQVETDTDMEGDSDADCSSGFDTPPPPSDTGSETDFEIDSDSEMPELKSESRWTGNYGHLLDASCSEPCSEPCPACDDL
jgi:hypothetical protein